MHATAPSSAPAAAIGTDSPSEHVEACAADLSSAERMNAVGQDASAEVHDVAACSLMNRVGRLIQDMNAGRAVTDAEVLQHIKDATLLSEHAYLRFEAYGNPSDRDEALLWQARAAEARRCLSQAFKDAREAQIQLAIAEGAGCFFLDQGDRDRLKLAGRGT